MHNSIGDALIAFAVAPNNDLNCFLRIQVSLSFYGALYRLFSAIVWILVRDCQEGFICSKIWSLSPVLENEETGLKPFARMSSNYSAGVPIKKRRYPIIRPPSPTAEEQASRSVVNDSLHKEKSSPSMRSVLSNASIGASSSGVPDVKKDSLHEERKGNSDAMNVDVVHSNASNSKVKIEEPNPTSSSVSRSDVENKEKPVAAEQSANCLLNSAKTELNLAPIEASPHHIGKDISSERKVDGKSKSEITKTSEITELSLGLKVRLDSAMAGQKGEGSRQNQESGERVSLNLSLSKGESSNQGKTDDVEANRSNWDLNTTMDSWDGTVNDEPVGQVTHGFNRIGEIQDIKPLICSVGMVGNVVTSEEQVLKENKCRSNDTLSPNLLGKPCNSNDNLHLVLSPPFLLSGLSQEPSKSSAITRSSSVMTNTRLSKAFVLTGNLNNVNIRNVKSEPIDESTKHDFKGVKAVPKGLLGTRVVKCESIDRCNPETLKLSNFSTPKLVDPRSVKPEPVHERIQESLKGIEETSNQSDKSMLQTQNIKGKMTSSADASTSGDVANRVEQSLNCKVSHLSGEVPQEKSESSRQVAAETSQMTSTSKSQDDHESNVSGMTDIAIAVDKKVDDTEQCRLKLMDEVPHDPRGNGEGPHDPRGNGEGSVSDEEKINLSGDMLEEDSYGSDYESDGNHNLGTAVDAEQDGGQEEDFEDGEVRESMVDDSTEGLVCEKREIQQLSNDNFDKEHMDFAGLPGDAHGERANKNDDLKDAILGESSAVETFTDGAEKKQLIRTPSRQSIVMLGMNDVPKAQESEQPSDQATNASQGSPVTVAQGSDVNVKEIDVQKDVSALATAEASLNVDDAAKDANNGGNKSRIITLSRTANMSSPSKSRVVSGRSLPSQAGRERFDVAVEGDTLHPRGRDEIYPDGSHRFTRERYQDQQSRNPRLNFVRGRGRISSRIDTQHGNWDPEFHCGPPEFRGPRHKYASEVDHEFNSYNVGMNGTFAGSGRGGRKLLNDEGPFFRHLPSRRRSPGFREGPPGRGIEMVRRVPRNISPGRCIGEDGSELVGLRHGEKFMKGLHNDSSDPMYTHPQSSYEGMDGPFVQGNRNFMPIQRRGPPRIRSKSPIGSRTRSPGTWSPPRRRSPDGFVRHPELPNQRSPPIFRMRSPEDSCFPGGMVVRGHGAPFMSRPSNELRDMDSGRDIGHHRSVPNRSPSGRILLRNNRRFDIADPHERTDGDDFFGRPMHPVRFQELAADGTGEERRRFGERRGLVRPFRPPYNGPEGGEFPLNAEGGPRPFRLCPNNDSEFHDRGNLREREFDRRIKNRPGNAPRRTRNIEEQDGNYRHGGQVWHDDGLDDMSRIKRKRF
ncbi:hypothetical protein Q3G72_031266 [Acer saccharum]|nr:hypothetical protein Q3G72_031266 [Acer saccharum]